VSVATRPEERELEPKRLRRVLVGRPMQTGQIHETLLPKWLALPIFASDPLSSVAYATESALVVLLAVSATSAHLVFPISIGIACLLGIVVLSYRQTVRVYETSGGAYVVARENLGTAPSLVAAAALLTDYVLTVAVSISAGIYAITSFAPHPSAARLFTDFTFGRELQQFLADSEGLYTGHPEVKYPADKPKLSDLKLLNTDPDELLKRNEEIKKRFVEFFGA